MIRLSVHYPATDGATFDHDYYRDSHVPLCVQTWGLDGAEIDRGVNGPYVAAVHFRFDSLDALQRRDGSPRHGSRAGRRGELHDDSAGPPDQRDRRLTSRRPGIRPAAAPVV